MYKFRDSLYYLAMINYHFLGKNCIELDDYSILIEPANSAYMLDNHYGYECVKYKVSIIDNSNNLLYRFVFIKTSASLEYVNELDVVRLNDYIFGTMYGLNGKNYVSDSYTKIKELQSAHPVMAKEAGLSVKDPNNDIKKEVYRSLKDTLNLFQINLRKMKKRTK